MHPFAAHPESIISQTLKAVFHVMYTLKHRFLRKPSPAANLGLTEQVVRVDLITEAQPRHGRDQSPRAVVNTAHGHVVAPRRVRPRAVPRQDLRLAGTPRKNHAWQYRIRVF